MNFFEVIHDNRLLSAKSQLKQEIFVLSELDFKKNGFFVEFGATNGIDISNTWLLEKSFGWTGILAEPSRYWHNDLKHNRSAAIDTRCVWSQSAQSVLFNEVNTDGASYGRELSTIDQFSTVDNHAASRQHGQKYEVDTVSLIDLLITHNAPTTIDYLSIDTEGSEFEILNHFDFDLYDIKIITCEHNYTPMREEIYNLLTAKGYQRKYEQLSQWDDWYVKIDKNEH
jgi:FkbM family methyltransferase